MFIIKAIKKIVWKIFVQIDTALKFPNLKSGEIGIQLGFDIMAPVTCDLFLMHKRVSPGGCVIGIDPDIRNIEPTQAILNQNKYNIILVQKAIFSGKGECDLLIGDSASWNQLNNIPIDTTVDFKKKYTVEMDSLDNIVNDLKIDIHKIGHINATINGAEYGALKGMVNILSKVKHLNLTITTAWFKESKINGRPDYEVITEFLHEYGFKTKFRRIHQLFWWGFIVKTILNRKWIYGKDNYGVIMAAKGNKKLKWYQSFS